MIKIQDIMRAGHIKRWNIVNTTRSQTLAEHMYNVTMIAWQLATELELKPEHAENINMQVLRWALVHDVPEVVTGDIPTPTKSHMKEIGVDMEDVYDKVDPMYKEIKNITCSLSKWIVKTADLIEAYWFIQQHGVGNHAKMVADKIYARTMAHIKKGATKNEREKARDLFNRVLSGEFFYE